MKEDKDVSQLSQVGSGIMECFGLMILQYMLCGISGENKSLTILLDVLKSDDDAKIQELATILGVGEDGIKQGVENIKKVIKAQAEKNGMSVDILLDSLRTCRA